MASIKDYNIRTISDPAHAIQSIEVIENDVSSGKFNECKKRLRSLQLDADKEMLLFHGTDVTNIDSIFNNNFNIEMAPANRPKVCSYSKY